jgi:hypothetical protein
MLLERLKVETDRGLQIAYSSALGNLKVKDSIPTLFEILESTENEGARLEIALALARIVGHEHHFIRLMREMRRDQPTAVSQMVTAIQRRLKLNDLPVNQLLTEASETFARNSIEDGIGLLNGVVEMLPDDLYTAESMQILKECSKQLEACKTDHAEYLILALHTLGIGLVEDV